MEWAESSHLKTAAEREIKAARTKNNTFFGRILSPALSQEAANCTYLIRDG